MTSSRFERQERLFGAEGQVRLAALQAAIVGLGGLGSHVAQQLGYLGVCRFTLIDRDVVDETSLNRLIGATATDALSATPKVLVARRLLQAINPAAEIDLVQDSFISERGFAALRAADVVIGCVDRTGARFVLNEFCQAYERPYLDIATDIHPEEGTFGGHVVFGVGQGCVHCLDMLDEDELQYDLSSGAQRAERRQIYGVARSNLGQTGPAVVSLNGVLASLAVTELIREMVGLGRARRHLEYRGDLGVVRRDTSEPPLDCYYCFSLRGKGNDADIGRYIRDGVGANL